MKRLLKADIYRMLKSRLTMVALILVAAFPVLLVLMYVGINALAGIGMEDGEEAVSLFTANTIVGSAYSLTNNIGLVIPAFAGILVCSDYTNGTLRNKVIAGNRRTDIYFSHLLTSIIFSVVMITLYAAVTTGLSLLFFDFKKDPSVNMGLEILYFVLYGTMSFVFMATLSTMLAMVLRNIAPTIIFSVVAAIVLVALCSVLMLIGSQEKYRYAFYLIPTYCSNYFNLQSFSVLGLLAGNGGDSRGLMFAEGMGSYVFFSVLNTVIGILVFNKRDIK